MSEKDKKFGVEERGRLIPAPRARTCLKRGFDTVANALSPTLGPIAGTVLVEPMLRTDPPEMLNDAATIAQRIVELPLPLNPGGMLMRHLVYRVLDRVGDGTATAAVIAQTLLDEATRYVAAGANPPLLRRGIETGLDQALAALDPQAREVGPSQLRDVAYAAAHEGALADTIGEVYRDRGAEVVIAVQEWLANELVVEWADGAKWRPGFASAEFITDTARNLAWSEKPWVLLTNLDLDRAEQVLPIMQQFASTGERELVIIGGKITESALATLLVNNQRGVLHSLGIQAPEGAEHRLGVLQDLAALTGGRVIDGSAGERLENAQLADLGCCDLVWASRDFFAVIGGEADDEAVAAQVRRIRAKLDEDDVAEHERENLRKRLGYLTGGVATLCVGAATKSEMLERKRRAERAVKAVEAARRDGVVPGGGVALLNCAKAVTADDPDLSLDERSGRLALARALEAPFRSIARGAGLEAEVFLDQVRRGDGWTGLDARAGALVDLYAAGIVDPLNVVRVALRAGVSGAVMALLTEAIVIPRFRMLHVDPKP